MMLADADITPLPFFIIDISLSIFMLPPIADDFHMPPCFMRHDVRRHAAARHAAAMFLPARFRHAPRRVVGVDSARRAPQICHGNDFRAMRYDLAQRDTKRNEMRRGAARARAAQRAAARADALFADARRRSRA